MPYSIYILYSIYLQRQKMSDDDSKNFFDYIAEFLGLAKDSEEGKEDALRMPHLGVSEARSQIGLDTGLWLSMSLIKEIANVNPDLLTSSLTSLLESLKQYRPGALYSATDRAGYQIDLNLNEARDFLLQKVHIHLKESQKGLSE
jgi:hypothetical protein